MGPKEEASRTFCPVLKRKSTLFHQLSYMPECPPKKLLFEESIVSLKYFLKALTRSLPTPEVRFYGFPGVCRLLDR